MRDPGLAPILVHDWRTEAAQVQTLLAPRCRNWLPSNAMEISRKGSNNGTALVQRKFIATNGFHSEVEVPKVLCVTTDHDIWGHSRRKSGSKQETGWLDYAEL